MFLSKESVLDQVPQACWLCGSCDASIHTWDHQIQVWAPLGLLRTVRGWVSLGTSAPLGLGP